MGRPKKNANASKILAVKFRLGVQEKAAFQDAANLAGIDLSAWIRERLRKDARLELEDAGLPVAFLNKKC